MILLSTALSLDLNDFNLSSDGNITWDGEASDLKLVNKPDSKKKSLKGIISANLLQLKMLHLLLLMLSFLLVFRC